MNQRKAIPANGRRFNPSVIVFEFALSHEPGSPGSAGTEMKISQNPAIVSRENTIPAIAAAFGVFRFVRLKASFSATACSLRHRPE
jgi:hypothetical protein